MMDKELYQFLNLYCGFIAHYNIYGFRETYTPPREFADVFIRHFDQDHRYFCGNYACHSEPYQNSGFTKAEIKQEFFRIVDRHKEAIGHGPIGVERDKRYCPLQEIERRVRAQRGATSRIETGGEQYVEHAIKGKTGQDTEAL